MLSFEFIVPGTPVSHQSRNKAKLAVWRQMVRDTALARWGTAAPLAVALRITVSYHHQGLAVRIDNDNLVKPIQDALIGLIYHDDRLITGTVVRKACIRGPFYVRGYSLMLLEALSKGDEFLHIIIDEAPDHTKPLR
jgi:hypothetical protein